MKLPQTPGVLPEIKPQNDFSLQLSVCLWRHDYCSNDYPTLKCVVVIAAPCGLRQIAPALGHTWPHRGGAPPPAHPRQLAKASYLAVS